MTETSATLAVQFYQGTQFLTRQGLNLVAVMDCAALPATITTAMQQAQVPLADYKRLVLVGHAGTAFWQALNEFGLVGSDPVDYYSQLMSVRFVREYLDLDISAYLLLYPGDYFMIPLQQLGALAGWHHPSPLGIGINHRFGVWFAYRAAFLIDCELPLTQPEQQPSPCAGCSTKPCISACPAGAVKSQEAFDVMACIDFRLAPGSPCRTQCLARLACPVAAEHRYSAAQIHYHSSRSLGSIRAWRQQQP
jgi:ferredoxin